MSIEFEVDAGSVEVKSGSGRTNVAARLAGVDIDVLIGAVGMKDILSNIELAAICDVVGTAELLDEIGEDACREHFGIPDADEPDGVALTNNDEPWDGMGDDRQE